MNNCKCAIFILQHLPSILTYLVQEYLHSDWREEFYQKHYAQLNFDIYVSKNSTKLTELTRTSQYIPCAIRAYVFKLDECDANTSLHIAFYNDGDIGRYFSIHLSSDIHLYKLKGPTFLNTYYTLATRLYHIFSLHNKESLYQQIHTETGAHPHRVKFDLLFDYISSKLATHKMNIEAYDEEHR